MRIAYLVNQYPMTSLSFIRREIRSLESQGFEVARFALRPWSEPLVDPADVEEYERTRFVQESRLVSVVATVLATAATRPGRFLRALWIASRLAGRTDRGLLMHWAYLVQACVLRRWLEDSPVAHLHAHFSSNSAEVAMLCRELGGPAFSFTMHGPEEVDRAAYLGLDEKVRRAEFVAVISDFCRSQLMRWCDPSDWEKIAIVHCGLEDEYFASSSIPEGDPKRLVCIGRLAEEKGQLVLVAAASRLAAERRDFRVTVIGDGHMRGALESQIRKHGLEDVVELLGWATMAETRRHLLECRALVLPSFAEGLPVVIMEALALERPVVSTLIAGIAELVESGESGWLIPAGNADRLVDCMREVLDASPERLAAMGRAGREAAWRNHRVRVEAARLGDLMRSGPQE